MGEKANGALRRSLYNARIPMWEVARAIGVHENTIIRWLREPLSEERRKRIERAVVEILDARERANEGV